jgi:uncharacterized protein
MFKFVVLILIVSFSANCVAEDLQNPVVDRANIFSESEKSQLAQALIKLRAQKDVYMAVLTTPDLGSSSIEGFAESEFKRYGIGEAAKDNGLLFVIAPQQRRMRLEVGYGLEGDIPDVIAKRIIDEEARGSFKEARYADGTLKVIERVASLQYRPMEDSPVARFRRRIHWKLAAGFSVVWGVFILWLFGAGKLSVYRKKQAAVVLVGTESSVWNDYVAANGRVVKTVIPRIAMISTGLWLADAGCWFSGEFPAVTLFFASVGILLLVFLMSYGLLAEGLFMDATAIYQSLPDEKKWAFKNFLIERGYSYSQTSDSFSSPSSGGGAGGSFSGGGSSGGGGASSSW